MKVEYYSNYSYEKFYHIYNHASNIDNLFEEESDCVNFLVKFDKYFGSYFDVLAYCLMPNHYHFVVKVKSCDSLAINQIKSDSKAISAFQNNEIELNELLQDQFRRFHSSVALKHNIKYKRKGQLFLNRHKHILLPIHKVIEKICYVHHNPIHHGFCIDYSDWKFSSFNTYKNKLTSKICKSTTLRLTNGLSKFIEIHDTYKKNFGTNLH